jgi:demethylmenaquinone methyltransferase/2-methoxy-6-polyprenyl-1,4-benzoquinol methylase
MSTPIKPYNRAGTSKTEEVAEMFDNISARYDFLNHLFSMGIDKRWRRRSVGILKNYNPKMILDVATGTGDFAIAALKLNPTKVIGIDISEGMLEVGRKKIEKIGAGNVIEMLKADSQQLSFAESTFDAITVGFGVRNFENVEQGLREMLRVLKPGGISVILELSKPKRFPIKQTFGFYSKYIMPKIGRSVSKDKKAYSYLPESVAAFPEGKDFEAVLTKTGYTVIKSVPVSGGIATIYVSQKPAAATEARFL